MLQALFCLILGNQVSARPQVNLVIVTGDSVTKVVSSEDKILRPISILRQSLPKSQGIVLLTIKENKDAKLKFQNQCKYKQGGKCEK